MLEGEDNGEEKSRRSRKDELFVVMEMKYLFLTLQLKAKKEEKFNFKSREICKFVENSKPILT
jgi:hypothetical protein